MCKIIRLLVLLIASSILFGSCGVIFGGSKYNGQIMVKDHPNAEIYVNGNNIGKGKAQKLFPRNRPLTVEVKQHGCENKTQTFDNTFRTGNFILSVLSWGLLGAAVDLGTGAAYKPDHISDPAVRKVNDKIFQFTVKYDECDNE